MFQLGVNPVRNSSGALNPAGIILKCNPAAEQRGIISNGVKVSVYPAYGRTGLHACTLKLCTWAFRHVPPRLSFDGPMH